MRIIRKYKLYTKLQKQPISKYPTRILDFKRTKWLPLKRFLERKIYYDNRRYRYKRLKFPDLKKIVTRSGKWDRVRSFYLQHIINKRVMLIAHNCNKRALYKSRFLPKKYLHLVSRQFLKKNFYIDNCLFFNNFSTSVFKVKDLIRKKKIYLNGSILSEIKCLTQNDFVYIDDCFFSFKNTLNKHQSTKTFSTCFEFDYYSQSLVAIKDVDKTDYRDFSISVNEPFNYSLLKKY